MQKSLSIYLDVVRLAAAVVVYLTHSGLITDNPVLLGQYGHSAVVVFFVLSGYVIAYVTDQKEKDWRTYAASRLSRVYSVVLPTLIVTLLADALGRSISTELYKYPWDQFAVRTTAALAMLNEFWFIAITPFSNVPYWSIAYESWFYLLFGVVLFAPGRWRWWALAALLLMVGPKIALMFPLWLSGVALYHWRRLHVRPGARAWGLVIVSWAGIVGLHLAGFFDWTYGLTYRWLGQWLFVQLAFSKFFVGDYVLAALVVANFVGMRAVAPQLDRWLLPLARPIAAAASVTFTLYLMHQPLLLCWATVLDVDRQSWRDWWTVTALVALSIVLIAQFTEKRRGPLRQALMRTLGRIGRPREAAQRG
jgi:peptidoglycan/LPS O-acetylase OafA/YrhL